jgi:hypothetical protein
LEKVLVQYRTGEKEYAEKLMACENSLKERKYGDKVYAILNKVRKGAK